MGYRGELTSIIWVHPVYSCEGERGTLTPPLSPRDLTHLEESDQQWSALSGKIRLSQVFALDCCLTHHRRFISLKPHLFLSPWHFGAQGSSTAWLVVQVGLIRLQTRCQLDESGVEALEDILSRPLLLAGKNSVLIAKKTKFHLCAGY